MPYYVFFLPFLPLGMFLLLVVTLGIYTHWYLNLVGFLLWFIASKLIQHLFLALLRLGLPLLSYFLRSIHSLELLYHCPKHGIIQLVIPDKLGLR